jgi:uncharacterized protein DUF2752
MSPLGDAASACRVEVPVLPAVGLSAATGGALAAGAAGLVTGTTASGWPCLFAAATGLPCPFCGLTHGVAALGAADVGTAVAAHPLAPLAVGLALAVPVTLLVRRRLTVAPAALWALALLVSAVWLARVLL